MKHNQRGQAELLAIVFFVPLLFGGLFALTYWVRSSQCEARWIDYKPSFGFFQGCMVEVKGKRIPSSSVRGNEL